MQDPLVGQLLDGRYRVEGRVAVGGMATVYRAVDTRLDRVLALKVMHPALATDTGFVERFIREAKAVAKLAHPNVVGVFDQGADGTYVYLAMEYVAGCTLRDVLRERGALQPRAALDILEPVLAALGAAHRAGLVHRDMKPENVLIGDDGRVKVADFGLVRAVDTQTSASTGALLGTVSYLAPEQIGHGPVDQRADVYACGVVLYEMLTGRKPYTGDTPMQVIFQHLNEDVPPPSAVVPAVAPQLDALVTRAASRYPQNRPADAVEMLAEVREVRATLTPDELDEQPADAAPAAPPVPQADAAPAPAPGSEEPTSVVRPARRRRRGPYDPSAAAPGAAARDAAGPGVPAPAGRPARPDRRRAGAAGGARGRRGRVVHQRRPVHEGAGRAGAAAGRGAEEAVEGRPGHQDQARLLADGAARQRDLHRPGAGPAGPGQRRGDAGGLQGPAARPGAGRTRPGPGHRAQGDQGGEPDAGHGHPDVQRHRARRPGGRPPIRRAPRTARRARRSRSPCRAARRSTCRT